MGKSRPRIKMPISERAKQFAPFSPLSGLEAALSERERISMKRKTLSEEEIERIGNIISNLTRGDIVTLVFYSDDAMTYIQVIGKLKSVNDFENKLTVNDKEINFSDIYDITLNDDTEPPY